MPKLCADIILSNNVKSLVFVFLNSLAADCAAAVEQRTEYSFSLVTSVDLSTLSYCWYNMGIQTLNSKNRINWHKIGQHAAYLLEGHINKCQIYADQADGSLNSF